MRHYIEIETGLTSHRDKVHKICINPYYTGLFLAPRDWGGGGGGGLGGPPPPPPPYDLGRRKSDERENVHVCRYLRKGQDGIICFSPNMQIVVVIA